MTRFLVPTLLLTTTTLLAGTPTTPPGNGFAVDPYGSSERARTFEVVPGKTSPWSFTIEPYLWTMGISGDIGVKGLPAAHVDYNPKTILENLKWGVMGKGEVRYGRWGLLGDGFFAELGADQNPPGPIYDNASITLQQGMAQLALAYRVFECRAGFLDFYAGARLNYFSLSTSANPDDSGIQNAATTMVDRVSERLDTLAKSIIADRAGTARNALDTHVQGLLAAASPRVKDLQRQILTAIRQGQTADIARLQQLQQSLAREVGGTVQTAATSLAGLQSAARAQLEDELSRRLIRRWALVPPDIRDFTRRRDLERILNPVRKDFRNYVEAAVRLQAASLGNQVLRQTADRLVSTAENRVAAAEKILSASIANKSARDQAAARRLVATTRQNLRRAEGFRDQASGKIDTGKLRGELATARKKLAKTLANEIEDSIPTGSDADRWWVDPIVGVRGQVNLTRWLFLATQCDVGGFGAGSQIAWNLNGSVGVNFTRNLFAEVGYRYFYMDYQHSGVVYDAAEQGWFVGGGVRF